MNDVLGKVIWFHNDLQMALIERPGGYTVGSVDRGTLTLGGYVNGNFSHVGPAVLMDVSTNEVVEFYVEADAMTEDEASDLLGIVRS